jgi:tetratricopeptide (TPR) repeat protein
VTNQRESAFRFRFRGAAKGVLKGLVSKAALVFPAALLLVSCGMNGSTDAPKTVPKAPADVRANFSPRGFSVTWEPVPQATHYTVFWGKDETRFRHLKDTRECAAEISGLKRSGKYLVAVTAWNRLGESDLSKKRIVVYDNDASKSSHYLALGEQSMERGRLEDAEAYFNAAVRLAPQNPDAYRGRSRFYLKIARTDQARRDARSAEKFRKRKALAEKAEPPWGTPAGSR